MVKTEQGSDVEQRGHEGRQPTSRPRRTRIVLAATLAGVLALGGGGGGVAYAQWNSGQNEQLAAARSAYSEADAANGEARAAASAALDASEGRVADDQVRVDLESAITSRGPYQTNVPWSDGSRAAKTAGLASATDVTEAETAKIVAATAAVVEAQAEWELEQAAAGYEAASAELAAALDAGAGVLAGSEGKVADDAVRQALTDALAAGGVLRGAPAGDDVDALSAATARVTEATAAVTSATLAASDAQAVWQAEQDRVAAEQAAARAAAEQAAAKSSTAGKSSSGKKSSSTSSSGRSSSSGAGAPSSSGSSSSGGGWVWGWGEAETLPDRCGDEFGNTWDC